MSRLHDLTADADVLAIELVGTLVVRDLCRPTDAFRLSQECFNADSGRYLATELAPIRMSAEAALRHEAERAGRSPSSVGLEAIYARVSDLLLLDPTTTASLVASELETERRLLRVDPVMLELCMGAVGRGAAVVAVGDTHLPAAFLGEVLSDAGATVPSDLLVSCETGTSITEGPLWEDLAGRFDGRSVVHVGTARRAQAAAGQHGIRTCLVPDALEEFRHQRGRGAALNGDIVFRHLGTDGTMLKNVHRSLLNGLVAHREVDGVPGDGGDGDLAVTASQVGFGALGPLMTAFVQWVHRAAIRSGCDRLHFAEADGAFLASAYRTWWGDQALATGPTGTEPAAGGGSAVVATGWEPAARWWGDGAGSRGATALQPTTRLCFAVGEDGGAPDCDVVTRGFIDARIEDERPLVSDLLERSRGFLERCLVAAPSASTTGAPSEGGDVDLVGVLQQGALEYLARFRRLTERMPSTVSIVDPHTACDPMVAALGSPTPRTETLVDRVRRAPAPPAPASQPGAPR